MIPPKSDDPFFKPPTKPDDPFFTPPNDPKAKNPNPPKANSPKPHKDVRDAAIDKGLAALAAVLSGDPQPGAAKGKGARTRILGGTKLGDRDFYFLWSLERVGVIFGLDKIGNIDWYDLGADELVNAQLASGGWGRGLGNNVDTSFALLFLSRSNLVRDLTSKVQRDGLNTELRAGGPALHDPNPAPAPAPMPLPKQPPPEIPKITLPTPIPNPTPAAVEPKVLVANLAAATGADFDKAVMALRDGKGTAYTQTARDRGEPVRGRSKEGHARGTG